MQSVLTFNPWLWRGENACLLDGSTFDNLSHVFSIYAALCSLVDDHERIPVWLRAVGSGYRQRHTLSRRPAKVCYESAARGRVQNSVGKRKRAQTPLTQNTEHDDF